MLASVFFHVITLWQDNTAFFRCHIRMRKIDPTLSLYGGLFYAYRTSHKFELKNCSSGLQRFRTEWMQET